MCILTPEVLWWPVWGPIICFLQHVCGIKAPCLSKVLPGTLGPTDLPNLNIHSFYSPESTEFPVPSCLTQHRRGNRKVSPCVVCPPMGLPSTPPTPVANLLHGGNVPGETSFSTEASSVCICSRGFFLHLISSAFQFSGDCLQVPVHIRCFFLFPRIVRKLLSSFLLFIRSYGGKSRPGKKGKVLVAQSCLTLCDPMDCSPPGSSAHGILQARVLEWVTMSFSRGLPEPGIEPRSLALQADSLPSEPPGSPIKVIICAYSSTLSQNFPVVFLPKKFAQRILFYSTENHL